VLGRTVELARIPAPTGAEGARAERVSQWWRRDGLSPRTEWIETAPVAAGLAALAGTIELIRKGGR